MSDTAYLRAMGCEVVVGDASELEVVAVRALLARRERVFSWFLPDSELSRVNASLSPVVPVSGLFAATLRSALAAAAATGGLVDPTLGRALTAAGYDRDFTSLRDEGPAGPAAPGRLAEVRLHGRLVSRPPGLALDLNGVVKGIAVDDAAALLRRGFVSVGGDLAVRTPTVVALPGGGSVLVERGGIATSGADRRAWERGGERRHHLIDPSTGRPSGSPWACVTVAAASCHQADVAAKAAFLLGDGGPAWLDRLGLPGRFRHPDGRVVENAGWAGSTSVREPACI